MPIKLVVAVTDGDWFETLRGLPRLEEVNFWAPGATQFRALQPGELFLFKLHAPRNFIVGGGVFAHASRIPCSLAWQAFETANGAVSLAQMRERIIRYRKDITDHRADFVIGCRILTQVFFFDEADWIPVPASWSPNIVRLKSYSTDEGDGRLLWHEVQARLQRPSTPFALHEAPDHARWGAPVLVRPRLGQGAFRMLVTDTYHRRCTVTGERTLPALEAAHIRPYTEGGTHDIRNGLLLRRDIHSLFDAGYVTVTPARHFEVSRRIREEFENGRDYYRLHGQSIEPPEDPGALPAPDLLAWHNENRFLG